MKTIYETRDGSIAAYSEYVNMHIKSVESAFNIFGAALYKIISEERIPSPGEEFYLESVLALVEKHDRSKYDMTEFLPYAAKFYPCKEDLENKDQIEDDFEKAWDHHKNHNPHHPEYWLINTSTGVQYMRMPNMYFMEMILDWIGVSIALSSNVLDWYYNNNGGRKEKSTMLSKSDIQLIDKFMNDNKEKLDFSHYSE